MALYRTFREDYDKAKSDLDAAVVIATAGLDAVTAALTSKLSSRSASKPFKCDIDLHLLETAIVAATDYIDAHNDKTSTFDEAKTLAQKEIEKHFLTSIGTDVACFDAAIEEESRLMNETLAGSPEQRALAARAGMLVDVDHHLDARQMRWQRSTVDPALGSVARPLGWRHCFILDFSARRRLLDLFEADQQLKELKKAVSGSPKR